MVGHDMAVWAIIHKPRHGQGKPRHSQQQARAHGLTGGLCRVTKFCIVKKARDWPLGVVSRYSLYIVTGGRSG